MHCFGAWLMFMSKLNWWCCTLRSVPAPVPVWIVVLHCSTSWFLKGNRLWAAATQGQFHTLLSCSPWIEGVSQQLEHSELVGLTSEPRGHAACKAGPVTSLLQKYRNALGFLNILSLPTDAKSAELSSGLYWGRKADCSRWAYSDFCFRNPF